MSVGTKVLLIVSSILVLISLPWFLGRAPGGEIVAIIDVLWCVGGIVYMLRDQKKLE